MKNSIVALLLVILTGCSSIRIVPMNESPAAPADFVAIKAKLDRNFRHVDHSDWSEPTGDTVFTGNCKQYANAAQFQLKKMGYPTQVYFIQASDSMLHMLTCSGEWCIDMYGDRPVFKRYSGYDFKGR